MTINMNEYSWGLSESFTGTTPFWIILPTDHTLHPLAATCEVKVHVPLVGMGWRLYLHVEYTYLWFSLLHYVKDPGGNW